MGGQANQLTISDTPTEREANLIRERLDETCRIQTNGEYDEPGIEINLVLRDPQGTVVGGVNASTMLRVMHLEVLWVAEEYRRLGHGRDLVLEAERIGFEKGCITSQTWSLSFQAPGFYRKIGYEVLGVYDGYPDGITETVLMKRLRLRDPARLPGERADRDGDSKGCSIAEDATVAEMRVVRAGLGSHFREQTPNEQEGIRIDLAIRDHTGNVIGGLLAFTVIRNLVIEHLWIDDRYRGLGLGKKLVAEAEGIAKENGCIACQTYCFSFQAPEFLKKMGYEVFGISDGYPDPVKEYYFTKRLRR